MTEDDLEMQLITLSETLLGGLRLIGADDLVARIEDLPEEDWEKYVIHVNSVLQVEYSFRE